MPDKEKTEFPCDSCKNNTPNTFALCATTVPNIVNGVCEWYKPKDQEE